MAAGAGVVVPYHQEGPITVRLEHLLWSSWQYDRHGYWDVMCVVGKHYDIMKGDELGSWERELVR